MSFNYNWSTINIKKRKGKNGAWEATFNIKKLNKNSERRFTDRRKMTMKIFPTFFSFQRRYLGQSKMTMEIRNVILLTGEKWP